MAIDNVLKLYSETIRSEFLHYGYWNNPKSIDYNKVTLNEIKIAKDKLNKNSLVLLDDKGSKTNLSIDYMLKNGFKIINETKEQVLLSTQI